MKRLEDFSLGWIPEKNVICFTDKEKLVKKPIAHLPYPVFQRELEILGIDKYIEIEKTNSPIMWRFKGKYFYKGRLIFFTRFENGKVVIRFQEKIDKLEGVDIALLKELNFSYLNLLEKLTKDEITKILESKKDSLFLLFFSGGKDSLLLYELCKTILPKDRTRIIFSDTTLEFLETYELINRLKSKFRFEFKAIKPGINLEEVIERIGIFSAYNRWCSTLLKVIPSRLFIKQELSNSKFNSVIMLLGIRDDEKKRRFNQSLYEETELENVLKVQGLYLWNLTSVYLYLITKEIQMNEVYYFGLNRAGCVFCPFSQQREEFFIKFSKSFPKKKKLLEKSFLLLEKEKIREVKNFGVIPKIVKFKRNWRIAMLDKNPISIPIQTKENKMVIVCKNVNIEKFKKNTKYLKSFLNLFNLKVKFLTQDTIIVDVYYKNRKEKQLLLNLVNKLLYCMQCGFCKFNPKEKEKMVKSLEFLKGCVIKRSLDISDYFVRKNYLGLRFTERHNGLGFKINSLREILENPVKFFSQSSLSSKELNSLLYWLYTSNILKPLGKISSLGKLLLEIEKQVSDKDIKEKLIWSIILVNLYFNSLIIFAFLRFVPFSKKFPFQQIVKYVSKKIDTGVKERLLSHNENALKETFSFSPIGKILNLDFDKNMFYIKREKRDNILLAELLFTIYYSYYFVQKRKKFLEKGNNLFFSSLLCFSLESLTTEVIYPIFGLNLEELEERLKDLIPDFLKIREDKELVLKMRLSPLSVLKLFLYKARVLK